MAKKQMKPFLITPLLLSLISNSATATVLEDKLTLEDAYLLIEERPYLVDTKLEGISEFVFLKNLSLSETSLFEENWESKDELLIKVLEENCNPCSIVEIEMLTAAVMWK